MLRLLPQRRVGGDPAMSEPQAEPRTEVSGGAPASPETARGGPFRTNLEQFGERAARLCQLLRAGRISSESCFRALTQLWVQVARSRPMAEGAEETGATGDAVEIRESNIL